MKQLKQLSLAVVLALVFGTSAMAGIITTPPAPPPPPDSISATGITETPPSAQATEEPSDPIVDLALTMLRVLSAF
jgi:hypothetical protein